MLNELLKTVKVSSFYVAIVLLLKKIGVVELRLFFVFYESVGMIKRDTNDLDIIIGPVSTTALSEADIDSLIASYSLPVDYKEQIRDFYDRTPRFTMSQFLNIMTLLNK